MGIMKNIDFRLLYCNIHFEVDMCISRLHLKVYNIVISIDYFGSLRSFFNTSLSLYLCLETLN